MDDLDENATSRPLLDQSSSSLNYVMFLSGDSETKKLRSHLVFTALAHIPWWLKLRVMYRCIGPCRYLPLSVPTVYTSGTAAGTAGHGAVRISITQPTLLDHTSGTLSEGGQDERFVIQVKQGGLGKQR